MHRPALLVFVFSFVASAAQHSSEQCGFDQSCQGSNSSYDVDVPSEHLSMVQKHAKARRSLGRRHASRSNFWQNLSSLSSNRRDKWWPTRTAPPGAHYFPLSAARPVIRIKAYYVNMYKSKERASCMEWQLLRAQDKFRRMGIYLEFNRWPAVTFSECTTVRECKQEHPQCFPSDTWTAITHPARNSQDNVTLLMRGVIGNWCSHLQILRDFQNEANHWDYFLAFEDDVILTSDFEHSLVKLLDSVPPLWTLAAFDTFSNGFEPTNISEDRLTDSGLDLFSVSGVKGEYWGAQAWIISGQRLHSFAEWYMSLPTMPLDWVPKAPRPMHAGFLAYNPGTALQRRFVSGDIAKMLPEACQNQSISDIRATSEERQAQTLSLKDQVTLMAQDNTRYPREVFIFGMYNTGTNLMTDLIRKNLEKPNDVTLCKNFSAGAYCGGVWKHTHPNRVQELPNFLKGIRDKENLGQFKDAVAVVMVRHPFSLMRSLQDANYDMDCNDPTAWGWLTRPCYFHPNPKQIAAQKGMPRLYKPTCYDTSAPCWNSIVSAWNSYHFGYLYELQHLFHKVIFVRYEDIISDPRPALAQIAFSVNVSLPENVRQVLNPSKMVHGYFSNDNSGALQKLSAPDYNTHYSAGEKKDICMQLNMPLLYTLGYSACRPVDYAVIKVADPNEDVDMDRSGRPMYSSGNQQHKHGNQQQKQGEQQ